MGPPRFVPGSAGQVQGPLSVEPQARSPLGEILGQVSETRGPEEARPTRQRLRRRDPEKEEAPAFFFLSFLRNPTQEEKQLPVPI